MTVVQLSGLRVEVAQSGAEIVDGLSFSVGAGEVVGLVGESGSGKTTAALALLGHIRPGTRIAAGTVLVDGESLLDLPGEQLRRVRGKLIAYVPQDPSSALNPGLRVGLQLEEMLEEHGGERGSAARTRIREVLEEVRMPQDDELLRRWPHQLSGGQQQRICLAMAFLLRPRAIVLDEPTTGLDVTTQSHVLDTVRELCDTHRTAAVYVSHDLAAVASLAQRVVVLYAGRVIEDGPTSVLFSSPGHPYTKKLVQAIPDVAGRRHLAAIPGRVPPPGRRPQGCVFAPRCEHALPACDDGPPPATELAPAHVVRCVRSRELDLAGRTTVLAPRVAELPAEPLLELREVGAFHGRKQVLHRVSLSLHPAECLALVGESGSGKTTLVRAVAGLHASHLGEIRFRGETLAAHARNRPTGICRRLQLVFQSPTNSLNPRRAVGDILAVPLRHFFNMPGASTAARVEQLLERVSLPSEIANRYPGELSGGERQRVAIARALAAEPDVLICDEITSALDASVQASILDLLEELRDRERVSLLFVTHDLGLVRAIADRVIVLERGHVVETGSVSRVLDEPQAAYTRRLLTDTPSLMYLTNVQ